MTRSDTDSAEAPARGASPWRNPWVLGWIAAIVLVLAVNATMVVLAIITNPGLVVEDYYERGRAIERSIVSRQLDAPDWLGKLDLPDGLRRQIPATVRVFLVDRAGQPVTPDALVLFAYRPADQAEDFSAPLIAEAPGRHAATLSFPLPGVWDLLIEAHQGGEIFRLSQRIEVAP